MSQQERDSQRQVPVSAEMADVHPLALRRKVAPLRRMLCVSRDRKSAAAAEAGQQPAGEVAGQDGRNLGQRPGAASDAQRRAWGSGTPSCLASQIAGATARSSAPLRIDERASS